MCVCVFHPLVAITDAQIRSGNIRLRVVPPLVCSMLRIYVCMRSIRLRSGECSTFGSLVGPNWYYTMCVVFYILHGFLVSIYTRERVRVNIKFSIVYACILSSCIEQVGGR